jgi:hypothetical protein
MVRVRLRSRKTRVRRFTICFMPPGQLDRRPQPRDLHEELELGGNPAKDRAAASSCRLATWLAPAWFGIPLRLKPATLPTADREY